MTEVVEDVPCYMVVSDSAVGAFQQMGRLERSRWSSALSYADIAKGQDNRERPEGSRHAVGDSIPSGFGPLSGPINPALLPFAVEFIGYPALSMLRQNIILQNVVTMFAEEMTKKWVEISPGDDSTSEEEVKQVRKLDKTWKSERFFRECAEECGYSGGCLAFIDVEDENLEAPLSLSPESIPKGSLKGFKIIEPAIAFAEGWQSSDPLKENYYIPEYWNINGRSVHKSRFLHFAETSVPVLLKSAYKFFGISMTQMLLDYTYNFERTRDAMIRAMRNHSLLGLKTDMAQILQGGEAHGLINRLRMMQATRDQDGVAAIDKDHEEFFQITTPLSGFMELGSMQLELLALASRGPVTKLFGTPPRGFNASGDNYQGDFASVIHGRQKRILHENVVKYHKILQLNAFGRFIEDLEYKWPDTREMTDKEKAEIRNVQAQSDAALVSAQIIEGSEAAERWKNMPGSGYENIKIDDDGSEKDLAGLIQEAVGDAEGEFIENDHPRDEYGQFASEAGSSGGSEGEVHGIHSGQSPSPKRIAEVRKKFEDSPVTEITGQEIDLFDKHENIAGIRKAMPEWAQSHGITGVHENDDTGWDDIRVSRKSIKETVAHGGNREKLQAIAAIPGFIENGVLLESQPVEVNPTQTSHIFAAKFNLAGKRCVAGFVVREDENGKRYYNHEMTEIKNLDVLQGTVAPAPGAASPEGKVGRPVTRQGRILNILHKYLSVK